MFGYDPCIMKKYDLDLTDMLLIDYLTELSYSKTMHHLTVENKKYTYLTLKLLVKDYPIVRLGCAGLKRRMNILIDKKIIERKSIYDVSTKSRKNYYQVNQDSLFNDGNNKNVDTPNFTPIVEF